MSEIEQHFYKYTVTYCEVINGDYKSRTESGLTFGRTFNEACAKITDYFSEDSIEELKIEFADECDVIGVSELIELFRLKKDEQDNTDALSTDNEESVEDKEGV